LPDFHQLDAKILHGLQSTVKLRLVPKGTDQDRSIRGLLDVQVQRLERGNEGICQLTAYPDLISEALSARHHAASQPCLATPWSDNGTLLLIGYLGHHSVGVIFANAGPNPR
jgi:hypothetical protein